MSELVERVAIAIFGVWRSHPPLSETDIAEAWRDKMTDDTREVWRRCARVAIEAMREPTDEMCDAGSGVEGGFGFCDDEPGDPPGPYGIWCAMIAAALTAKP